MKRSFSPSVIVFIAFGFTATACSSNSNIEVVSQDTSVSDTATSDAPASSVVAATGMYSTADFATPTISWDSCGDGLECGYVDVPIDYADVNSQTTSLYVVKHLATDISARIGSLLVNPGGPGFGGS